MSLMSLCELALSLTFAADALEDADNTVVADPLKDEAHAVAALAKLVLGFRRCNALDAALDAFGAPTTHESSEPPILLGLADATANFLSEARAKDHRGSHIRLRVGQTAFGFSGKAELLLLDDREDAREIEILALGLHPALLDVDNAGLEDVGRLFATWAPAHHAAGEQLVDCARHAALFEMNPRSVQLLRNRVDMAGDCVGAEDMARKGVELRGGVAEEVGEGDSREGV